MLSNNRDDREGQLRAELIQEERELRPLRDRISEAERSFDLQLEALDRKSEVQDISHVINFQNQTSQNIRKQLENLSAVLEENEQRLEESVAEANRWNRTIEEAKKKIEDDRRNVVTPLYESLHRAQADLCFERNARSQEPRRPSLSVNSTMDSMRCQIRDPSGSPSKIKNSDPGRGFHSDQDAVFMEQASERHSYTQRTSIPNIRPFTTPWTTCDGSIQERGQQLTAVDNNCLSWQENLNLSNLRNGHFGSTKAADPEIGLGAVYSPPETREASTACSSLTTAGSSLMDPYTNTGSDLSGGHQASEDAEETIEFSILNGLYTSPECMKGVPVAKIVEGDTYWVTSWTKLNDWHPAGDEQTGRDKSVEFFIKFDIHPNQLLAKQYNGVFGLCNARYPIILRRIFQVLECSNVKDPIRWFRNRLAQLITGHEKRFQGPFALKTALTSFQKSDPIYDQYYKESRYKSIDFASISKKGRATRFETVLPHSDLATKRAKLNNSPLSIDHSSNLPRLGSGNGPNVYDLPDGERMIIARTGNRDYSQMPPLLSPLRLDSAFKNAIEPTLFAARVKGEGSKAIISGGDVLFDLYFISCGKKEYGDDPPTLKFDAASGETLPLHPISGDLSAKFPELIIRSESLDQVTFATGKEVGDIVILKYKVGEGSKMQLGFRNANDAVLFVTFLSTHNKKLKLNAEDSERIAGNGFFK